LNLQKERYTTHAKGNLLLNTINQQHPLDAINNFINQSACSGTSETFYNRVIGMGMPAGDTIRWTKKYWLGPNEILCELRSPKTDKYDKQFVINMHPGVIDACIQTLFLLLPDKITKPYVASHMGQIEFYGIHEEPKYVYTQLKKLPSEGKKIIGDWYLLDKNHRVLARCVDLCMAQYNDSNILLMDVQSQFHLDLSLPYEACKNSLIDYLVEQVSIIFSMPHKDISVHYSLLELGMDSLMALAIIRIVEANLGVTYSLTTLMQGPSISDIAEQVLVGKSTGIKKDAPKQKKSSENIWLSSRIIQPNAKFRLFCFPYGGGGASIYREWQQQFPDSIEVCPVQLPGRENRMEERPLDDIDALVTLLADKLYPEFNLPFAFFGHSFGSLIGFELARYLRKNNLPQPVHLFASAYPDPRMPSKSLNNLLTKLNEMDLNLFNLNQERISQLTDEQLTKLSIIFKDNGIVDYSDERMNKSIIQVLLPIFIGDMNIVKHYVYRNELPLELPLTVFLGKQDAWVTPEDHKGWSDHSLVSCELKQFDSGHLFIREKEIKWQVIQKITEDLERLISVVCD
jgi:surfactin synthase thioesterase subunit/acyl carrier protein